MTNLRLTTSASMFSLILTTLSSHAILWNVAILLVHFYPLSFSFATSYWSWTNNNMNILVNDDDKDRQVPLPLLLMLMLFKYHQTAFISLLLFFLTLHKQQRDEWMHKIFIHNALNCCCKKWEYKITIRRTFFILNDDDGKIEEVNKFNSFMINDCIIFN